MVTLSPGYIATPMTAHDSFSLPFRLRPEQFAERAAAAIAVGASHCVIPWQMGLVAWVLRRLPNWLLDRLLAGRPRKARAKPDPGCSA